MAACALQKPDLFGAVVCSVPVADMLRYTKFGGGANWISEYGDPAKKTEFERLLKYSPYHNVKKAIKYPAFLITSAENDTRVGPMHARKFAARLQAGSAGGIVLLTTGKKIGHGFGMPLGMALDVLADQWAFIYSELEILHKE